MRNLLIVVLVLIAASCLAPVNLFQDKPDTIDEAMVYLDEIMDDTTKYNFMTLPGDIAVIRLHMTLGMWIRNNWGL